MRILPLPTGEIRLRLDIDEAMLLSQLSGQLIDLLQSHSSTALDPDPLFASLEVGGSQLPPEDPALARLFPAAYEDDDEAAEFRSLTEQGLLNRKLQDALVVTSSLALIGQIDPEAETSLDPVEVQIAPDQLPGWVRTLTALRLAIAARIGIESVSDHAQLLENEDSRGTILVYDWIGAILDSLLRST